MDVSKESSLAVRVGDSVIRMVLAHISSYNLKMNVMFLSL